MENRTTKTGGPADHLANERTFLAWIRTSIALMGFGFVIVKFALFVKQLTLFVGEKAAPSSGGGFSALIGIIMVALGAIIAALSFFRFRNIQKHLELGTFYPSKLLSVALTIGIIVASILLVVYLMPNLK